MTKKEVEFQVRVLLTWLKLYGREGKGKNWYADAKTNIEKLAELLKVR